MYRSLVLLAAEVFGGSSAWRKSKAQEGGRATRQRWSPSGRPDSPPNRSERSPPKVMAHTARASLDATDHAPSREVQKSRRLTTVLNDTEASGHLDQYRTKEAMPYVNMQITRGATREQKAQLVKDVTESLVRVLGKKPEHTHVVIQEIAEENWGFSGLLTDDWKKQSSPNP